MTHKKEAKALNFRGDDDVVDEWMKCLTTGEVACVQMCFALLCIEYCCREIGVCACVYVFMYVYCVCVSMYGVCVVCLCVCVFPSRLTDYTDVPPVIKHTIECLRGALHLLSLSRTD